MNSQVKTAAKRNLLSGFVNDMAQTIRDHQSLQQMMELLDKQLQLAQRQPLNHLNTLQARELLDQIQARVMPQLCTTLCADSPWFGSAEKRLTGLGSATLFMPVTAASLAQKHQAMSVQQQLQRMGKQTEFIKEQLQRKIDRLTGVRAKTDEWETTFPEDE